MNLKNVFNQVLGGSGEQLTKAQDTIGNLTKSTGSLAKHIPGGLLGGAAAGGVMTLLAGNKSARKFAGKAATYGGTALLGGLAYKAFQNYQQNADEKINTSTDLDPDSEVLVSSARASDIDSDAKITKHELILIMAMIAGAKADGHIDAQEQQRILEAVNKMDFSTQEKGLIFDLLQQDISVEELASAVDSIESKSEVYLVSCMMVDLEHPVERDYLDQLALALQLPAGLVKQLESQAFQAISEAA